MGLRGDGGVEGSPCFERDIPEGPRTVGKSIIQRPFGIMPDGRDIDVYVLRNRTGMRASVMTYGAIVTSLTAPDRHGVLADVVLGFEALENYLGVHPYFGAIIGRYANRIGNATFTLDGQKYSLTENSDGHHLHGGFAGFDKALWLARPLSSRVGPKVELSHVSPDGDQGYPGRLAVAVTYSLTDDNEFRIEYRATTDRPTHVNLTHHSYFNLAGAGSRDILDHVITIDADRFTPVDAGLIPTGEVRDVAGTPMNFRSPVPIGSRIDDCDEQLRFGSGYDHNWILNRAATELSLAARVSEPTTGRVMEVLTTEPGVQLYTGNYLDGTLTGKQGTLYGRRCAFCLETQHFPDSPNRPEFPTTVLRPGEVYETTTVYRFRVES